MNPLLQLQQNGQAVWLDYIRRSLIESGELAQMVENDGLRGVTSNPAIFMKAITGSDEYDLQIRELLTENSSVSAQDLYEALAVRDIQAAADVLLGTYSKTEGADGYVSLEVSPHLAHDTAGTIEEGRRLWQTVDRPNLMIKVPATEEGIPAIEALLSEGISVNVTLMFSMAHYEAVAQAYLRALRTMEVPSRVASVASFFISRVTTAVDSRLDEIGSDTALALKGKIAIANGRVTYQRYQQLFEGEEFADLRDQQARPQRVLWASTGTKNPDYSDVLYVEELVGENTVNTIPPATLDAFRDHGNVRGATILEGVDQAGQQLQQLQELGIDLNEITEQLQKDGIRKFREPFDEMLEAIEKKRDEMQLELADS